jgi:putative transposase
VLDRLIEERGRPENVRSDNGPEFTSRRMLAWSEDWKVGLVHIQPGRPMQNGHVENFHGLLRDECLNASWFLTLNDVRTTLADWWQEYNWERPHSSPGYLTPEQYRKQLAMQNSHLPVIREEWAIESLVWETLLALG